MRAISVVVIRLDAREVLIISRCKPARAGAGTINHGFLLSAEVRPETLTKWKHAPGASTIMLAYAAASGARLTDLKRDPALLATFIILLLAMFGVALAGINADSIWYDEYLSLHYAGALSAGPSTPMDVAVRLVDNESGQAPFYYVLLSAWGSLAGWSEFATRMLSLLAGVLAVSWVYRLAADLHSSRAGLTSAAILAGSAFFIVYLHEIRVYSLLVLEVVVLLWLYWRLLTRGRAWPPSLLFVLFAIIALHSHPFMALLLAAIGAFHIILARGRESWTHLLSLLFLAGLLFLPWAWITLGALPETAVKDSADLVRNNLEILRELAFALSNGQPLLLILPFLSLRQLRHDRNLRMLWLITAAFFSAMLLLNSSLQTVNQVRYFMPGLPLLAILGGMSLAAVLRSRLLVFALMAAWCLAGFLIAPSFGRSLYIHEEFAIFHIDFPFKEVVADIRRDGGGGGAVIYEFPYHSWGLQGVFDYYMRGSGMPYVLSDTLRAEGDWGPTLAAFERFIGRTERVYFVLDRSIDATAFVPEYERILGEQYFFCERLWDTAQLKVDKYASSEAQCQSAA